MIVLLLLLHTGMQASANSGSASQPMPIDADRWVTTDDYPAPAQRAGEEGTVFFELDIDDRGMPRNCTVVRSSGSAILDVHTCDLMQARAHFKPARDANGNAVSSKYDSSINWQMPAGSPIEVSQINLLDRTTIDLSVSSSGLITKCSVVETVGSASDPSSLSPCTKYPPGSRYSDPTIRAGKPISGRIRITNIETRDYD